MLIFNFLIAILNFICIFAHYFKNIKNKKIIAMKNKIETYNKYTARLVI